jgi:hypothetical protein
LIVIRRFRHCDREDDQGERGDGAQAQESGGITIGRFYQPDIFAEIGDTKRPCLAFG